ncbi:MAG: hypothetical protein JNK82_40040 [Myxococcaceae bacterium]|nr:hypothetical protein [Myxococcaceae bacterium]
MSRALRHSEAFRADIRANVIHLVRTDRLEWLDLLHDDLAQLQGLLVAVPRAGVLVKKRGASELRKMRLRRTPFTVFYACRPDDTKGPVVMLRLWHLRANGAPGW